MLPWFCISECSLTKNRCCGLTSCSFLLPVTCYFCCWCSCCRCCYEHCWKSNQDVIQLQLVTFTAQNTIETVNRCNTCKPLHYYYIFKRATCHRYRLHLQSNLANTDRNAMFFSNHSNVATHRSFTAKETNYRCDHSLARTDWWSSAASDTSKSNARDAITFEKVKNQAFNEVDLGVARTRWLSIGSARATLSSKWSQ